MTQTQPPLMESKKVLAAARPPEGLGPSTSAVLRGLRETRPPAVVLVGFLLSALAPLGLLAVAVFIVVQMWSAPIYIKFFMVMFTSVFFMAAALAWRGTKRTVHLGEYDGAFFIARLAAGFCAVAVFAALGMALTGEGGPPWSFALIFVATAVLWLPWLPFSRPSAKEWGDRVLLRRGLDVHGEGEAQLLAAVRPHSCGFTQSLLNNQSMPLLRYDLIPVQDDTGRGWGLTRTCCGEPWIALFRWVGADRPSDVGGGDRMWAVHQATSTLTEAEASDMAQLSGDQLAALRYSAVMAAECIDHLLALIPADRDAVPGRRRTGMYLPLRVPETVWGRAALTEQLARWRGVLDRIDAETASRVTRS